MIEKVHLFLQSTDFPNINEHDKLNFVKHGKRPMFSELFAYGNALKTDYIKIVANSDIFFDNSLHLANKALQKWDVLALTRWDMREDGLIDFYNNFQSQDVWIFQKPINCAIGEYHIGRHGCDNRLAFEFKNQKYKIANPSFDIKVIHVHNSNLRSYFRDANYEFVSPPYEYLLPIFLGGRINRQFKIEYFNSRYRYFKSLSNKTLPGVNKSILSRIYSFFISKYFAQMLKRFA